MESATLALLKVDEAFTQYADVRAVRALANEIHERPAGMQDLGKYADDVVASAFILRLNGLKAALSESQDQLSVCIRQFGVNSLITQEHQAEADLLLKQIKETRDALKQERTPQLVRQIYRCLPTSATSSTSRLL